MTIAQLNKAFVSAERAHMLGGLIDNARAEIAARESGSPRFWVNPTFDRIGYLKDRIAAWEAELAA